MKLLDIWMSRTAWQSLASLRIAPQMALDLSIHQKQVWNVLEVCMKEQEAIVKMISEKTKNGVSLVGSQIILSHPEDKAEQEAEFVKYLEGEVELPPNKLKLKEIVEEISKRPDNVISSGDLLMLAPFFTEALKE